MTFRIGQKKSRTRPKQEKPQNPAFKEKDPINQQASPGRPPGRVCKRSISMAMELLETCEITPLEYLLNIMTKEIPPRYQGEPIGLFVERRMHAESLRFEAAKAAAPYMHPKVGSIDPKEFKDEKKMAAQIAADLRMMLTSTTGGE